MRRLAAAGLFAVAAGGAFAQDADVTEPDSQEFERSNTAPLDPVSKAVHGDALTQIRIAAIAFQNPKNLGQALSGVIGAFLKRDRFHDASVDLSVIKDPVWRSYALLHFAEYHYARGELDTVKSLLKRVDALTQDIPARQEEATILAVLSQRQAEYGQFNAARRIAARIPVMIPRIRKLLDIAELQSGNIDKKIAGAADKNLRLAFEQAKRATIAKEDRMRLLLSIAKSSIRLGYPDLAQQILEFGYRILASKPYDGNTPIVAEFAAQMVRTGSRRRAMEIVRSLKSDLRHSYTLASVARAFARSGSIEGAVPLFYLALQGTENLEEGAEKVKLLTHILKEQTRSGRLADAFNTAGKIKDKDRQREALFEMAEILLEDDKPLEALKLIDYLPDMGMRAQILTRAARFYYVRGERKQASELMLKAVKPTGKDATVKTLTEGIPLIFEAQVEMGKGEDRDRVFDGARALLDRIPNEPVKVPVMTRIARAEMRDGQQDAADRSLGMAWRIAWLHKDSEDFPNLLTNIALTQLNIGELLLAFDTAARIADQPLDDFSDFSPAREQTGDPKMRALTAVAVAAARKSEGQLALRAARAIKNPSSRAGAYREIALAFPIASQQAETGKGRVPIKGQARQNRISPAVEGSPVPTSGR